jgi:CPA2 family monovalent cation:H+ antiporter-2
MVAVSALVLFSGWIYRNIKAVVPTDFLFPDSLPLLFTIGMGFFIAIPLVAIWRNLEALSMIFAEAVVQRGGLGSAARAIIQPALRIGVFVLILLWIASLIPYGRASAVVFGIGLLAAVLASALFWKNLIRWHSHAEIQLHQLMKTTGEEAPGIQPRVSLEPGEEWNMRVREIILHDASQAIGRRIADLPLRREYNCTIASVDRQGVMIANPPATTFLYPNDKLLLLGGTEELDKAEEWLVETRERLQEGDFSELQLGVVRVPASSPHVLLPLRALALNTRIGVQITGVSREGKRILNPGGDFLLQPGDELLLLGRVDQISAFAVWLSEEPESLG